MLNQIHIEEITSLDANTLHSLSELLCRVVNEGASIGFLPPLEEEEALGYWREILQAGIVLWVAIEDGRIIGTVQLHLAQKANATHRAEIAKLMVDPDYRRKGISRLLMQAAERRAAAEERSLLVLDTRSGDPSNHLYLSLGFVEAGRIPGYARSADGELHETVYYYKRLTYAGDLL
ncbi:acetyltransferase [Paenibacillus baekrokdamisoli]|uniref:Acetyltransferase n=1 Tax=Paenibacillus baekrokdamisoli TaxID=1712516 RepID=A0A3G9J4A3_9BACL|nr:GNAT family N-acetyltransferase [Paenibacillus baekrokdamisoli]MBB3067258.1 ribosomal protein S18 acetylase RimI-like enzyme [Paenibacillus baekrokdamisoli]BBH19553.1 acetyltransferase [Paenibacillus baekrokdamisoli]